MAGHPTDHVYGQAGYPPKRVTSPNWGPTPPCKQALREREEKQSMVELLGKQAEQLQDVHF